MTDTGIRSLVGSGEPFVFGSHGGQNCEAEGSVCGDWNGGDANPVHGRWGGGRS